MNKKHIDPQQLIAAHDSGLNNRQLAQLFGVSEATIKRSKQPLRLQSNCPHNNRGKLTERLVAAHLGSLGLNVTAPERHNGPFDLLVNGWRVEVKLGSRRANDAVQFRLPRERGSNGNAYLYTKDYGRDADFLALVDLSGDQIAHLYLLPIAEWNETMTVHPASPFCPYRQYQGAWDALRVAFSAVI